MAEFEDLLATKTVDEYIDELETYAADEKGLPVSNWQESSIPKMLIDGTAVLFSELSAIKAKQAAGHLLPLSTGTFLTHLAYNIYQITRRPKVFAVHQFVLDDDANTGPHTIAVGSKWVQNSAGLKFVNKTGGTLSLGGTLTLEWTAERAGVIYNISANDTTLRLVTTLSGVLVTNPAIGVTGVSLVTEGEDEETDESLRARCSSKWPALSHVLTDEGWEHYAREADSSVQRVLVQTNPGSVAGRVGVIIAGANSALSGGTVAAVNTVLQALVGTTNSLVVSAATEQTYTISGVIWVNAGFVDAVEEALPTALADLEKSIDIGGRLYTTRLIHALEDILEESEAVHHVSLTAPLLTLEYTDAAITSILKFSSGGLSVQEMP